VETATRKENKHMALAPFTIHPFLTSIAIAYRNPRLIADDVLPRVPVGAQVFRYRKYALGDAFTVPDTRVGRKSQPNQIEFGYEEIESQTEDHALDSPIPQADKENAPPNVNPEGKATETLADLVLLDREIRAAQLVFNEASYGPANKTTLAGTDQFSDFANSDPISVIQGALDSMILRGSILVAGRAVWSALARHPQIVRAFNGNDGSSGMATRAFVAQLFELDQVLVGEGWLNSSKKGQTPVLSRVWGNDLALLYRNANADTQGGGGFSFGMTGQFGTRIAGSIVDPNMGMRGGTMVRVGESVKEIVTAPDLGYLIQSAVADAA